MHLAGVVADGYISGAKVYIDLNDNGVADSGEDTGLTTDSSGHFTGTTTLAAGHAFLAVGGVNTDTGLLNTLVLKAPSGATVINPITSLVQAFIEAHPGATTASAGAAIKAAFGLASVDLMTYDPLAAGDATGLAVQKIAAQVASLLILAASSASDDAQATAEAVIANLMSAIEGGTPVDLTDSTTLATLLTDTCIMLSAADLAATVMTATCAIHAATCLTEVSTAQAETVGALVDDVTPAAPTVAPDLLAGSDTGSSTTDNLTYQTSPIVRVAFNTSATDGTAAAPGDVVKVTRMAAARLWWVLPRP